MFPTGTKIYGSTEPNMEAAGIEPACHFTPESASEQAIAVHGPASTDDMIRWLEDADQTITADLRRQIAARLREQKPVFIDRAVLHDPDTITFGPTRSWRRKR